MGLPVREGLVRLVNFKPIFVDSQSPDFCVKRWSWEPQFGCRTTRPRDTARTFWQCGVNHFLFLPLQRAVERRCRTSEFWRLPLEPRLIQAKNVVVAQDHGSLNYVRNSRTLAGQPWGFDKWTPLLSTVLNFFRDCIENPLARTPVNGMARAADAATGTKVADELFFPGAASLDEKTAIDRLV